jgi:tRNA threonylcarbamoyladenosine biosynthesis protein TsaB
LNILAIETASEACSVALGVGEDLHCRFDRSPRGHAERVLPWVDELLQDSGRDLADLDVITFSQGPGSFTSLRIGISVVQGLAWGAEVPVVPLSSLRIAAQVAAESGVTSALVAMDARMGEVFCGRYQAGADGVMRPIGAERVCSPEAAAALAAASDVGVGNGFLRYGVLADCEKRLAGLQPEVWPDARVMPALARHWLKSHSPLPAVQAQPVYLRDRVAEKSAQA